MTEMEGERNRLEKGLRPQAPVRNAIKCNQMQLN